MQGVKYDGGKPRFDLVPARAQLEYVKVLTWGAENKYEPDNWRRVKGWRRRYFAAAMRHMWAWWSGKTVDEESGLHPLAHVLCCVLFLLELELIANDES